MLFLENEQNKPDELHQNSQKTKGIVNGVRSHLPFDREPRRCVISGIFRQLTQGTVTWLLFENVSGPYCRQLFPSRDGKHLAINGTYPSSNAWLLENF
jgi:hypothetical protein